MKKRLLSLALVLAMVLSLVPVGMVAAETEHVHCMCGLETTKDATCEACGTKAVVFTGITAMPSAPGNYYLTTDVAAAPTFLTSGEYSFCLCGHDLTSAAGKRIIDVAKAGTKLTITDCQEEVGSVTGATGASATGSALCVNSSGELNLYNAKITGNTAATNGVILVSGGTFNMYSGEISGNTSGRGAVYIDNTASVARFLGGKVTGNHSKNTGAMGGGGGVYGMKGTVELGGTAQIFGNTAAEASRNPDLYIRNDQGMKVQLSATKPLENGAKLRYGLWTAEADTTNMTAITGAPTVWSSTWLRYNGTKVAYADGKFFLDNSTDHVHCLCGKTTIEDDVCPACGNKAVIWSATNTVPTTDGHFYLTDTVKTDKVEVKANAALCLHGKNLESKAGNTIIKTMPGYTFQLTDCNETVGSVTGVTATTAMEVQTGSTFVLWNGKITGNTGTGNGTVWVAQGNATLPGGNITMYGGEISGNTTARGAVFTAVPSDAANKTAIVRLLGGKITGNTGTNTAAGMGGGAGVYALSPVEIGGTVQITGNDAKVNNDNIYLRNDGIFTGKLIVSTEKPLADGANVNYGLKTADADITNLTSISGTPADWNPGWVSYEETQIGYADGKFFLEEEHIHCLCGKETTLNATCAACGAKAVKWTGTNALPTKDQPGYYYLTEDVSTAEVNYANGGEFAICLHGKTLKSAAGSQILEVFQGATMHLTDCKTTGTITGVTGKTTYGSCMRVDKGGLLTMRNITVTGNTAADEGIIYVDGSDDAAVAGGTFIMYSGSINGNTLRRGAVYGVSTGKNPPVIKILGGEITGNTGTGTGNRKAGAGVYSFFPVEVGGEAKIYGNTAKEGPADLYLRNDGSYTGKVVVSSEAPLTDGANIQYSLWTADADPTDLKMITGAPAAWNKAWVTYDGEAVDYADGKFFTKELPKHVHCLCGKELTLGNICASCGTEAKGWTGITEMPGKTASGYYYLENNIKTASFHAGGDFAFCLNGHDLISAEGNRVLVAEKNTLISITDCQPTCGKITGATGVSTYGSTLRASTGGKITMYNGKVTGNTNTGDGTVYAAEGTADVPGGVFTMYGGEISGNTAGRGAVYGALATAGKQPSVIRILGGTITGNTGLNTGGTGGGAGVYAMHPVEIGGDAKIYGNTAKKEPADMLLRNDQGSKLTVSAEKPLTDGANINYGLNNAEADPMNLTYITGAPTNWNMEWVKYDGVKVGYEAGRFYTKYALDYADHDHDGQKWISVTQENRQWPNGDGYYVLESDVKLEGLLTIAKDNHVHLCLNGHTLTAADNSAHFDVYGKLTVCDCTAKTVDGTYTAGKIAGGTGKTGGSLRVRSGAEMTLIDGIFTENACAEGGNGGAVYADAGAVIKMTGGMFCGNTGSMGGAIRLGAPNVGGPVPTFILEGGSICHNESINMGGGIYAAGGADIQLIGGTIANNTAAQGGGGIGVNSQGIDGTKLVTMPSTITLTGTTIADNEATTWGGNVYIKTGTVMNMQGGVITGGKSKVGAGILLESKDTTLNLSGGKINGNFGGAAGAAAVYASNNTIVNMTGGEVCNNVAEAGGGGIVLYAAKGTFTGGIISGNSAKGSGAGLCVQGSEAYLGKITISGNKTTGAAGGLYVSRAGDINSDVTIDGTQILNNVSGSSGGGIFLYMNGNKITMLDGVIAGNQAKDGGGAVIQREVTFIMKNGTIKNNRSTSNGGGFYASIDSTFTMEGGTITGNYANVNGGGMYCLRSNVTLSGGTITGNQAKNSGGGVIFGGAKGKLCGTTISYNSCEGSGSGVMVLRSTGTVDGVKKTFDSYVTMTGGTVTGNTTKKAGAGVLVNGEGCHFTLYGGTISYNKADKFGAGIYIGKNGTLDMHGGTVCYNESIKDACGGVQLDGAIANLTGGKIHHNKAARSAGGVLMGREGVVRMSNVEIYENSAKLGGGMVIQGKADLIAEDLKIYNNSSTTDAGGVYLGTYTHPTFKNSEFYGNTCAGNGGGFWSWATSTVKMENCKFYDNTAEGEGGGFWTRGDAVYLTDCVIEENQAAGNGGGFGSGIMGAATPRETPGIVMKNCSVEKNISGGIGGGMFIASGAKCDMKDVRFVSNTAEAEGGAFWAKDELTVHDLTVNNNQSGGAGYAVYLDDSDYDGHSYVAGLMKFSGNVKVHDNQGGDLYLGEKTPIVIGEDGLGQDTLIHLVMHSGLLTDWVFGAYDYEGGNLEYTITYGDRSLTDPEQKEAPAEEKTENRQGQTKNESKGDTVLYIAVGAVALVVIALVAVLLGKKKKSAAAEKK